MDSDPDRDSTSERRNSNTEYIPTKCRITKPPPPKPATNPLQFIKVAPCPLFQKAQEQIKKVEEIKKERKEVREEPEDWQANLDNWKSSRRKRQEHIIERVVEVKKLEQEENDRHRRKSKTFSEMIEDRSKGRHKFNIPVYDDDSNDLSDYGIGSSSSKTNSIKDVDTDDSGSILDEKDHSFDSRSNKENSSASNQSQSEDETNITTKCEKNYSPTSKSINTSTTYSSIYTNTNKPNNSVKTIVKTKSIEETRENIGQYTYEGAIQDYRSRIRSKINVDESIFTKSQDVNKSKEFSEAQVVVPRGEIFKRKGLFEVEKPIEIKSFESNTTRRLSEDFANTQSIKDRLKSLEKCTDQPIKSVDKTNVQLVSVKQRLQSFNKQTDTDNTNNIINNNNNNNNKSRPNKISNYLIENSNNTPILESKNINRSSLDWRTKDEMCERSSSPETEMYLNKLNMFNRDLDNLYGKSSSNLDNGLEEYCQNSNYPPSTSSTELMGLSSDREDSGIHTADVSCSVSQADEPVEDTELAASTIPSCIEKLNKAKELEKIREFEDDSNEIETKLDNSTTTTHHQCNSVRTNIKNNELNLKPNVVGFLSKDNIINCTLQLLQSLKIDATENLKPNNVEPNRTNSLHIVQLENIPQQVSESPVILRNEISFILQPHTDSLNKDQPINTTSLKPATFEIKVCGNEPVSPPVQKPPAIYENIEIQPYENSESYPAYITQDLLDNSGFSFMTPKLEPPKVKPPPPPPVEEEPGVMPRLNSTKRIKKEIQIKRSSFLGLDEPSDYQIEPDASLEKPPDINSFLQKESKLEKSLYKKVQEENRLGMLSKVESQDSGLDIDRGRLSSDTWCSSIGDTHSHGRQDSDPINSITSEEDEMIKKEREIIEMVEKEEKSRDGNDVVSREVSIIKMAVSPKPPLFYDNSLGSEKFGSPYFPSTLDYVDPQVLKVEQDLCQLEREELERQTKENLMFRESRAKALLQNNRHSLENLCDDIYPRYDNGDYRKSMTELQHVPLEYRKSMTDVPNAYKAIPNVDVQYRKSMPDIQHAYNKSTAEYHKSVPEPDKRLLQPVDYRKSMPDLQHNVHRSAFKTPVVTRQQHIMPGKPIRPKDSKDRFMMLNPVESDALQHPHTKARQLSRNTIQALSAAPRPKHNDNWIQPRANPETKSYSQHWLCQEAELRRISEQKNAAANRNVPQKRPDSSPNKEYIQQPYLGHSQTMGHALPTMPYIPPTSMDDSQERMLSVSGKKKCSFCDIELGRGAAMIIESLSLFYHMDCFKCCVCHMKLGDGRMGTDVRVRNEKLHCHNCYSSDDGVKFSCV